MPHGDQCTHRVGELSSEWRPRITQCDDAFGDIGANFQALEKLQFFTGRLRRKLNGGRSRALDRLLQIKTR
jgi:hypothetical protein